MSQASQDAPRNRSGSHASSSTMTTPAEATTRPTAAAATGSTSTNSVSRTTTTSTATAATTGTRIGMSSTRIAFNTSTLARPRPGQATRRPWPRGPPDQPEHKLQADGIDTVEQHGSSRRARAGFNG